jgi:hypothetical protein
MEAKENGRVKKEWCHSWIGAATDVEDEDAEMHGTNCVHLLHKAAPEAEIYVEKVFQGNRFRTYHAVNIAKVSLSTSGSEILPVGAGAAKD